MLILADFLNLSKTNKNWVQYDITDVAIAHGYCPVSGRDLMNMGFKFHKNAEIWSGEISRNFKNWKKYAQKNNL